MKKLSVLILTGLLFSSAFAESNWYGGIGVVKSSWNESVVVGADTYNLEYDKANAKAFIGVKLSNNFATEFQYTNFGKDDITVNGVSVPIGIEGSSFGGALLYNFAPESDISVFAKIGYHAWDLDLSISGLTGNLDDNDLFYGVGVDRKVADNFFIRIDYERFELEDTSSGLDTEIDNFGVSAVFNF